MSNKASPKISYGVAIREGFEYLLSNHPEVFVIGQGLWSPWYVGNTMTELDAKFGKNRIIDTPVSESACTGAAVGASLAGMRPIVVHPRIDFMLYALDSVVNQAAKWSHMIGGQAHPALTIRGIINRGGEQGAQHSQALHSWFAHIPGLRVVMPYSVADARDLLVASVLSNDPVVFIDDRWLYENEDDLGPVKLLDLKLEGPKVLETGPDVTIVGCGFSTQLGLECLSDLKKNGINAEIIDLRILNPMNPKAIIESVNKTGSLVVIDGGWKNCGIAGEVISSVVEDIEPNNMKSKPLRITLPDCPAPTSAKLEKLYYPSKIQIVEQIKNNLSQVIKGD